MSDNPWRGAEQRYHRGRELRGRITVIASYGCYVELEPGVEGLVQTGNEAVASRAFRVGSELDVVVVDVDAVQRRIALGLVHAVDR